MGHSSKFIVILFLFFFACNNKTKQAAQEFEDIDVLNHADIAISKGNQKIVNAFAAKLLKDETHIYLKALSFPFQLNPITLHHQPDHIYLKTRQYLER